MHVWITGGGTGGHVYPALTVLEAAGPEVSEVLWIGTATGMEASIVRRHGVPYRAIPAGPLVGTGPVSFTRGLAQQLRGAWIAWRDLGRRRPDAVLATGGYVAVPVAIAAWLRRVPLAVFLPDVRPGRAVSLISRLAAVVTTTSDGALPYLPSRKTVVTGYPVRASIRAAERDASLERLGLCGQRPIVLVFGGSQGARRLNRAVAEAAEELLDWADLVHVSGRLDCEAAKLSRDLLPESSRARYRLLDFLHSEDMAAALASADVVVSRAGAAVIGEYPARGLASILVPLPIAGGHQRLNAGVLAENGAAVVVDDAQMNGPALLREISALLDNPEHLEGMRLAAASLDKPDAARDIWNELAALAKQPPASVPPGGAS
jgi:UDP-N-acetylglucosamine--N-acetylmuramyl-(pentapeptide) pyrophosphoryl-undecaprenol N-acetylglucosamine transferase